ncbi:MAG TPA: C25 family cysteine peptidase [Candidatus Thermoplasmatota archaeon]
MNLRRRRAACLLAALMIGFPLGAMAAAPAAAAPTIYPLDPIPGLEYVAIAPVTWADALGPLIDWKTQKGVPAQTFTLESILSTYTRGRDSAERLHDFLQDLYFNKTAGTPRWLLLVGDGDWTGPVIPLREVYTNSQLDNDLSNNGNWYTTDTYYGNLESDWDEDGDGIFGELDEGDWTPEMYVGRLPFDTLSELDRWVQRQLTYERDPPPGPWQSRGILAGALMDRPNVLDDPATPVDEGYDPFTDNARKVSEEIAALLPDHIELTRLYDNPFWEGGQYTSATDTLVPGAVRGALDGGAAFLALEGHGYTSNRGVAQYADPQGTKSIWRSDSEQPALTYDEVLNLTNGDMLPFVYVSACYAGDFTDRDDTSFEAFLSAPAGGAIAVVAGNGENYRIENVSGQQGYGNWWLAREFFHMLFREGYSQPGKILGDLKARYNAHFLSKGPTDWINQQYFRAERVSYNLMGDPEFSLITAPLAPLAAAPERQPFAGESSVTVLVTTAGGAPVADALVRLEGPGGAAHGRTDATGRVALPYAFADVSAVNLTATAQNHFPLSTSFVPAVPERNLAFDPPALASPGPVPAGTVAHVSATVVARGIEPYRDVTVEFRTQDPTGGPLLGAVVLPFIAPGSTVQVSHDVPLPTPGDTVVYVRIDPGGLLSEDTRADNLAFVVLHANHPPAFSPLPLLSMPEGTVRAGALDLTAYSTDRDDGSIALTYRVISVGDPRLEAVLEGRSLGLIAASGWSGQAAVILEASDGIDRAVANLTVQVTRSNLPPVIAPIMRVSVLVGQVYVVELVGSDPEGGALVWSVDSAPLVTLVEADRALGILARDADVGRHLVTVTASDGVSASRHTFVVEVEAGERPIDVRNPPRVTTSPGHTLVVDLNQVTGDPAVEFITDRGDVMIDNAARTLTYTPAEGPSRLETIELTATKPGQPSAKVAVSVEVVGTGASVDALGALAFVGAFLAIALVVGLTLWREHQQRLRDEKIFRLPGKPPGARKKKGGKKGRPTAGSRGRRKASGGATGKAGGKAGKQSAKGKPDSGGVQPRSGGSGSVESRTDRPGAAGAGSDRSRTTAGTSPPRTADRAAEGGRKTKRPGKGGSGGS